MLSTVCTGHLASKTACAGKLKPMQREILWLAYAQGSSHAEIAEIVGVHPEDEVAGRVALAEEVLSSE